MKVCNSSNFANHLLIEIVISRPIDILQIYELLSMGIFFMCIDGLCYLMLSEFVDQVSVLNFLCV
jgi:hypothetical protein